MAQIEEISILPFSAADINAAFSLWKRTPGMGLSAADGRDAIASFLNKNRGLSFSAKDAGILVGTVLCGSDGRRGYLYHLAVDFAYRRRGIGKALSAECLAALHARGIDKCHLFVLSGNETGIGFWSGAGWTRRKDIVVFSKTI